MSYVAQSAGRIFRALFEITAKNNWPRLATKLLGLTKMVDKRIWSSYHPLRQFPSNSISPTILQKLEEKRLSIDRIRSMSADELAGITHANKIIGRKVLNAAQMFPRLEVEASVQPITRTVLKVQLTLTADFIWNERIHGTVEPFWIWIEDAESEYIYHSEYYLLHKCV
jgi:activating signal cointegrator complex subunit 3